MTTRQLAAIMFTDIVGYTELMGRDERAAMEMLNRNRGLQKDIVEKYNGRWIKEMGDGILTSFNTVTEAVTAAMEIHNEVGVSGEYRLRTGIHLGEVIFDAQDVFGDGVNWASRIQSVAAPGAICISEMVRTNLLNKKEINIHFIGEKFLKNIPEPVRIYEVVAADPSVKSSNRIRARTNTDEKSIAVLPFVNMSNDPEQEFFCDGISEEIISSLAQLGNLRVIARTSAFSFKNRNLDVREIGKALDVSTLLEGSVRKSGQNVRITTQLIRVADGSHLWSNRYDRILEDIFSIQEDIAGNVAKTLKGVLSSKEKEALQRPETIIEAYTFYLKGRQLYHQIALGEAKEMFEKAIALDPEYAPGYAGLADTLSWMYEWEGAGEEALQAAEEYSQKALLLAPESSESHSARGFVLSLGKQHEAAEMEFEAAIAINPNSFDAYYYYGRSCFARGQIAKSAEMFHKASEARREDFQSALLEAQSLKVLNSPDSESVLKEGIRRARKQLELNPADRRALSLAAGSLFDMGENEEAIRWISKAFELYPDDAGVLINGACLYTKAGDYQKALDILESAVKKGFGKKDWIEHDPDYDPLRNEPRFKALLKELH